MKFRLKAQTDEDRRLKSRKIQEKLLDWNVFKRAKTVLCYASFGGEVETWSVLGEILKLGKTIGLPKVFQDRKEIVPIRVDDLECDLESGSHGIFEPKYEDGNALSVQDLDLVLVPALAYDRSNYRLGRGAGYYDRFLSTLPHSTVTVGLAFDFQIIESLPEKTSFDLPVSLVITN